ncbi:MAG: SMP-30/gluconolactonase/LRE family protein [Pirellulaceae bacterium]
MVKKMSNGAQIDRRHWGKLTAAGMMAGIAATREQVAKAGLQDTTESLVAEGASLECLTSDCKFTEGPAVAANGEVFFTDQPNNRILKVDLEGKVSEFLKPAGRSNGLFFAPDGKLIACADEKNELWEIDVDGSHRVLSGTFQNKPWNGPNDLWIHPKGFLFFTDPYYQRPWWNHTSPPQPAQHVYRCQRDGSQGVLAADQFKQPNGIVGNPETGELFVADIGDKKTYRFQIAEDGTLTDRLLFCEEGSDGMTLDRLGNLYLTGSKGVSIFDPSGRLLERITVPQPWTANVCFGGPQRDLLYITASTSLYRIPMKVKGW